MSFKKKLPRPKIKKKPLKKNKLAEREIKLRRKEANERELAWSWKGPDD